MDWGPYNPRNPVYMKSFLMNPVKSKEEVLEKLKTGHQQLQQFSNVSNQLLRAAVMTMPRTPVLRTPLLYSGQPDLPQLRARHIGAQFLEFPGNAGPPNKPLEIELEQALATFLRPGSIITTKKAWSFGDTLDIAMYYHNGYVLIAHPPRDSTSLVWEVPAYITDLSNRAEKIEWVFPVMSSFRVLLVKLETVRGEQVYVIHLESLPRTSHYGTGSSASDLKGQTQPQPGLAPETESIDCMTMVVEAGSLASNTHNLDSDLSAIKSFNRSLKNERWSDGTGALRASLPVAPSNIPPNNPMRERRASVPARKDRDYNRESTRELESKAWYVCKSGAYTAQLIPTLPHQAPEADQLVVKKVALRPL